MIRNPYAKKAGMKRTRPPDNGPSSQQPASALSSSSSLQQQPAPSTSSVATKNDNQSTVRKPLEESNRRHSWDDAGIDWDAAFQIMEQASTQRGAAAGPVTAKNSSRNTSSVHPIHEAPNNIPKRPAEVNVAQPPCLPSRTNQSSSSLPAKTTTTTADSTHGQGSHRKSSPPKNPYARATTGSTVCTSTTIAVHPSKSLPTGTESNQTPKSGTVVEQKTNISAVNRRSSVPNRGSPPKNPYSTTVKSTSLNASLSTTVAALAPNNKMTTVTAAPSSTQPLSQNPYNTTVRSTSLASTSANIATVSRNSTAAAPRSSQTTTGNPYAKSAPPAPAAASVVETTLRPSGTLPLPPCWDAARTTRVNPPTAKMPTQTQGGLTASASLSRSLQQAPSNTSAVPNVARALPLPPTWTAPSTTSHSNSQSAPQHQQQPEDPNALPPALQYAPACVQPLQDEDRAALVKNANLSQPLANGWTLFSHQKKAILRALVMRRFILALDMGLGKTLIGCVWAKAFHETMGAKIYVVCPVSLTREWGRTAKEATSLSVVSGGGNNKNDNDDEVNLRGMEICSWAKIPKHVPPEVSSYVVVFDEAHSMQSLQAARTKEALQLVRPSRCVGVLMLTGTPMKNGKPLNLFPLLKAVRHPFGDHQKAYETHFCAGRDKSFGRGRVVWDANGSSNLSQLRQHVGSHLLHMTKEQCLKDLPPLTRVVKQSPVSSRHQLKHNQALEELARLYAASGSFENSGEVILTAVQRVRQIGSFAKIDATVAITKEVLESQPAVVIFTSFVEVARQVHSKLKESGWEGELLTGETAPKKRQGMVDNFQAGLSPVFVSTFGAGGVGLTLTAAHTIILLDRPWTPGDAQQAEDRVRRIGQTKPVTSIWMLAFDLDKQIDSVLEQKKQTTLAVLEEGDGSKGGGGAAAPKISIFQLLRSVLGSNKNNSNNNKGSVSSTATTAPKL